MTWNALVREYLPDSSDEECSFILWNCTSFPFGDEAELRRHLTECAAMGVEAYSRHVIAEMDRCMAELRLADLREAEAWRIVDERARELWAA